MYWIKENASLKTNHLQLWMCYDVVSAVSGRPGLHPGAHPSHWTSDLCQRVQSPLGWCLGVMGGHGDLKLPPLNVSTCFRSRRLYVWMYENQICGKAPEGSTLRSCHTTCQQRYNDGFTERMEVVVKISGHKQKQKWYNKKSSFHFRQIRLFGH